MQKSVNDVAAIVKIEQQTPQQIINSGEVYSVNRLLQEIGEDDFRALAIALIQTFFKTVYGEPAPQGMAISFAAELQKQLSWQVVELIAFFGWVKRDGKEHLKYGKINLIMLLTLVDEYNLLRGEIFEQKNQCAHWGERSGETPLKNFLQKF